MRAKALVVRCGWYGFEVGVLFLFVRARWEFGRVCAILEVVRCDDVCLRMMMVK